MPLVLISILLGVLAGIFLKWWVICAILFLQFFILLQFSFPDSEEKSRAGMKAFKSLVAFQIPAWLFFLAFNLGKEIVSFLSSTLR